MNIEEPGTATPRLYLLDVEGTVAPISLLTEVLFPYARDHFAEFLRRRGADKDVRADLAMLAEENRREEELGHPVMQAGLFGLSQGDPENASYSAELNYLLWLMDRDRKSTALKSLQGKIWKIGFESGELKGTLFDDVPPAIRRWSQKARVAIYSSGSAEAQQILFRHTVFGDLTPMISGYFDTRTGAKTVRTSYAAIAEAMGVARPEIAFYSDVVAELDAAREAGCRTRLVIRPGNAPIEGMVKHEIIHSFDEATDDDRANGESGSGDPVTGREEAGRL